MLEILVNCMNGASHAKRRSSNVVRDIVREKKAIDEGELLGHLDEMNQTVDAVLTKSIAQHAIDLNEKKKKCTSKKVYVGDERLRIELFQNACGPTDPLDMIFPELFEKKFGVVGRATYSFLCDPFYQTTRYPIIQHGIFWAALLDDYGEDPYESVIELYKVFAQAGWSGKVDEMFVFVEQ